MNKWINGTVFVLCLLIGFYFLKQSGSKVEISTINIEQQEVKTEIDSIPKVIDIGNVKFDTIVFRQFVITNKGKSPLLISHIDSGCGCVKIEFDHKPVEPDSCIKITVRIKPSSNGYFSKKVFVFCNVPKSPFNFTVKGVVGDEERLIK